MISAMEAYNRPDSPYREEAFAILALNAWELLVKAKVLASAGNKMRALHVYEPRTLADGSRSSRLYLRKNRAGNPHTIGLAKALACLESDYGVSVDPAVKANLDALTEIRDNAVHFINAGSNLSERVLEIGTAAVRNFMECARQWCNRDMSTYNMYLLPIGFVGTAGAIAGVSVGADEQRLISYLAEVSAAHANSRSPFHAALEVAISLKRCMGGKGPQVQITRDPTAPKLHVADEDITRIYPWDYGELTRRLTDRYVDFKANQQYHNARKALKGDQRYVKVRLLDPGNPEGIRKEFYNPNIVDEFDKLYTRK